MNWPGDTRPLWERVLEVRVRQQLLKTMTAQAPKRMGPCWDDQRPRRKVAAVGQIGATFYMLLEGCGHVEVRRRQHAEVGCSRCFKGR